MSPLSVLSRGYSVLYKDDRTIRSVNDVTAGNTVRARLSDGEITLKVIK